MVSVNIIFQWNNFMVKLFFDAVYFVIPEETIGNYFLLQFINKMEMPVSSETQEIRRIFY